MALGTNYARLSFKSDIITKFALLCLSKGENKEDINKICKKLKRQTISEVKRIILEIKIVMGWIEEKK